MSDVPSIDCKGFHCNIMSLQTGKETVTLIDGGSYMDSAEVFAMIRGSVVYIHTCTHLPENYHYVSFISINTVDICT